MTTTERIALEISLHTEAAALLQDTGAKNLNEVVARAHALTLTDEQSRSFTRIMTGIAQLGGRL